MIGRAQKGRSGDGHGRIPLIVLLPTAVVAAAMLLPLFYLVLRAAESGKVVWELLFRVRTLRIIGRTLALVIGVTGASVLVALPLSWLVARTDLPFRKMWYVLSALPLVMPSYVAGFIILAALGPRGMLQSSLEVLFGVKRLPEIYGYPGALLTIFIISYPLMMLTIKSSLDGLDPRLEEISRSLGQGPWHTFFRVTLPQLRPAIASGILLVSLYTLRDFGAVSLLRYETFTWAIYLQYKTSLDRNSAAGLSLILMVVAFSILAFENRTRGRAVYFSSAGSRRSQAPVRLGRWKWPALAFSAFIVFFSLLIPMAVLIYWLIQGVVRGEPLRLLWLPAFNSVYVSALSALVSTACSLPVAFLTARRPGRLSNAVENTMFTGYALPGIVVALALVFFSANFLTPLYQSLGLLVFAYLILFIPQSFGAIRSSILKLNPHIEEAAKSLGRSPSGVISSIVVPLVRPGIIAGAFLVFFTAMKELPATLILSPIGFKTLATSIWSATSEAFFVRAAVPALLLILASSVPLALFTLEQWR